jgi:hypothetical protein
VIVAGREQSRPHDAENMARCLFGADRERLLLTGEYVPQMRGHRMRDGGSRTAVAVQVHPDLRVQALVEQVREREVEQMVGRLRLVHRARPARVLLLTNLPTALPVDRLVTWAEAMPCKLEQAIVAGRGVLPLSYAELARAHPSLWATNEEARMWLRRKGGHIPLRVSYWNLTTLSVATLVSYRRPGQRRGSPHQAILPGDVRCPATAARALEPLLGVVEDVRIVEMLARPGARPAAAAVPSPVLVPEHEEAGTIPEPAPGQVRDHFPWQVPSVEPEAVQRAVEALPGVVEDARPLETLHRPEAAQPSLDSSIPAAASTQTRSPGRPSVADPAANPPSPSDWDEIDYWRAQLRQAGSSRTERTAVATAWVRAAAGIVLTSGELDLPDDLRSCLARSELRELARGLGLLASPRHPGAGNHACARGRPMASPAPTLSPAAAVRLPRSSGHRGEPLKQRRSPSLPIFQ